MSRERQAISDKFPSLTSCDSRFWLQYIWREQIPDFSYDRTAIEQQCNAAALEALGVPVIPSLHHKYLEKVNDWILNDQSVAVSFSKETASIAVGTLVHDFLNKSAQTFDNSFPEFY